MSGGPLVVFKSVPDFWRTEYVGNKPNTVRILDDREYSEKLDFARACLIAGEPATIGIVKTNTGAIFYRRITDISEVGQLLGKSIWVISWRHEDGEGTYDATPSGGEE